MVSELIGYIKPTSPTKTINLNVDSEDEQFIVLDSVFRGLEMQVVVSAYVYDPSITGTVKIIGSYCTIQDYTPDGNLVHVPFIIAKQIEKVPDETELTNKVVFTLKVTKVSNFLVTKNGLEILFLYGTVLNAFRGLEVYKVCLKGKFARKYRYCKKGEMITASAYMKAYGQGIEFTVDTIFEPENSEE